MDKMIKAKIGAGAAGAAAGGLVPVATGLAGVVASGGGFGGLGVGIVSGAAGAGLAVASIPVAVTATAGLAAGVGAVAAAPHVAKASKATGRWFARTSFGQGLRRSLSRRACRLGPTTRGSTRNWAGWTGRLQAECC